jgi:SPX domain
VKIFFERIQKELGKVNDFYTRMEEGFCERGEEVLKQLQIMLEVKQVLKDNRHRRPRHSAQHPAAASPGSTGALLSRIDSASPVPGKMLFLSANG